MKVRHLVALHLERSALVVERCKAWCYSNIACQYWQFSQTEGCLVDAPMLGSRVPYPLTTEALERASEVVAGEHLDALSLCMSF